MIWFWLRGSLFTAALLMLGYFGFGGQFAVTEAPKSFLAVLVLIWLPATVWRLVLRRRPRAIAPWSFRAAVEVQPSPARIQQG